jgi:hypothetical protein
MPVVGGLVPMLLLAGLARTSPLRAQGQPVALQAASSSDASPVLPTVSDDLVVRPASPWGTTRGRVTTFAVDERTPWWTPVASALIPGSGQFVLKQQRSVAYLAAEGFLILQYVAARRDGNRGRTSYRSIAADVARKSFGGTAPAGSWEYYEFLEKYLESGAYDLIPGGAVDPETDESTYNGARWLLARQTYWRDPDVAPATNSTAYQSALAAYKRDAATDAYRWSWRDAQLQQDLYRQAIASANRSYQRAVNYAGIMAANHLLSLVDAYVTVRVRRYGGAGLAGLRVEELHTSVAAPELAVGTPARWQTTVRLTRDR